MNRKKGHEVALGRRLTGEIWSGLRLFANGLGLLVGLLILYPIWRVLTLSLRPHPPSARPTRYEDFDGVGASPEGSFSLEEGSDEEPYGLSADMRRSRAARRVLRLVLLTLLWSLLPPLGLLGSGPAQATHASVTVAVGPNNQAAGSTYNVTVTVTSTSDGSGISGAPVNLAASPIPGPNEGQPTLGASLVTTNAQGVATTTITSTNAGTSVITATFTHHSGTASATWVAGAFSKYRVDIASPQRAADCFRITVTARDANNNQVTDTSTANLTSASDDGVSDIQFFSDSSCTTPGNDVSVSGGTGTASSKDNDIELVTVTATSLGAPAATGTATVSIIAAAPAQVTVAPSIATNTAGTTHTVTATVTDTVGNRVSGTAVTFTAAGTGVESPSSGIATTDASGQASFSFRSTKTGTSRITATAGTASGTASKLWRSGPVTTVTLVPQTATNTVGDSHKVTATVIDQFGNFYSTQTVVTFTVTGVGAQTATRTVPSGTGVATFVFTSPSPGVSTITASAEGKTSDPVTKTWLAGGRPLSIALTPTLATNVVGTTHTVTATVTDTFGNRAPNVPVTFSAAGAGSETPSSGVATTDANGQASFSFRVSPTVGTSRITATADGASATATKRWISGGVSTVTLEPTGVSNFVNTTHTVTATVKDQFGNAITTPTVVTFTLTGRGTPTSGTGTTGADGKATFSFSSTLTGVSTVTASAQRGPLVPTDTVTSGPVTKTWTFGPVATITVTPTVATNVVGTTHTVTATVTDQFGNKVSDRAVTFAAAGTGAESPSSGVATTDVNGDAAFRFRSSPTAGVSRVTATADGKTAIATKTWISRRVSTVTVEPSGVSNPVNSTHTVTATVRDDFGNAITTPTVVTFTAVGTGSESPSSGTRTTDVNGRATFSFRATLRGTSTITAVARDADTGANTTSSAVTKIWTPGPAATVTVTPVGGVNGVGQTHTVTASVQDEFENAVADGTPVTFTVTGQAAQVSTRNTSNGLATFSFRSTIQGSSTITASVFGTRTVVSNVATKTWTVGARDHFQIDFSPASPRVNTCFTITVSVRDQFGNLRATESTTADMDSSSANLNFFDQDTSCTTLFDDVTITAGQGTITAKATAPGTYRVTATEIGGPLTGTAQVTIVPGPATTITLVPTSAVNSVDNPHTVTATLIDRDGFAVADGTIVTFTVTGRSAQVATRTTSGGVAVFSFSATQPGTSTITASAQGETQTVTSNTATKTWTVGAAANIALDPPTDSNTVNTTHTVTATVTDEFGNNVEDGTTVDFTVAGTGGETPTSGSDTTVNGQATFQFTSTRTGTSRITATSGSAVGTATKDWTTGAPSTISISPATDTNTINSTHTVTATVRDADGNLVPGAVVTFTVAGTGGERPTSGSDTTDANGQATFDFTSTRTGTSSITATSGSATGTATKTWIGGPPATIDLSPPDDTNTIDTAHVVTAIVRDADGNVVPDQLLVGDKHECLDETCTSIGPFTEAQTRTTDANGQATFTFNSHQVGRFVIHVFADNDPTDGTPPPEDEDTPRASVFKTWICGPFNGPYFPNVDIARDIALLPGEDCAGYVLDGFGARHPFGGAPATNGGPYFPGFDIARSIVINPAGTGGYVLDGFGARHPFGIGANSPPPTPTDGPYFAGFDIANDLILTGATKGYVLDGFGARHPWGGAPATTGGPYFPGYDIARAFDMLPAADGSPGYVLDGLGGRHPFNGAAAQTGGPYFPGFDIARDIVMTGAGQGYVLDGFGARHPFGGQAPTVGGPYFPGFDISRGFAISGHSGIVLEGFGGLHVFRVP